MKPFNELYKKIIKNEDVPTFIQGSVKILSHWIFQGFFRMGRYERILKIACTGIFAGFFYFIKLNKIKALFFAHTLNFFLNSHLIAALKTCNIYFYKNQDRFDRYASSLLNELVDYDWVNEVYVTGSVNRDEWHSGSDLDVVIVREPGIKHGIRGALRGMVIRFSATINLFPLDMYIFDEDTLKRRTFQEDLLSYSKTG